MHQEMDPYIPKTTFFENDPKYMCCCNGMHSRTGTTILCVLGFIGLTFEIIMLVISIITGAYSPSQIAGSIVLVIVGLTVYISLALALKTEKKKFTYPYLGWMLLILTIYTVIFVFCIILLLFPSIASNVDLISDYIAKTSKAAGDSDSSVRYFAISTIFGGVIGVAFILWFTQVVYKFYKFLKDKEQAYGIPI